MIKNLVQAWLGTTLLLLLNGCGPVYKTDYTYTPPKSHFGIKCIMQCEQQKQTCNQTCQSNYNACEDRAHQDANTEYKAYAKAQTDQGKSIDKDVNSFLSDYNCGSGCDCDTPYRSCYVLCGGAVHAITYCTANCDKA